MDQNFPTPHITQAAAGALTAKHPFGGKFCIAASPPAGGLWCSLTQFTQYTQQTKPKGPSSPPPSPYCWVCFLGLVVDVCCAALLNMIPATETATERVLGEGALLHILRGALGLVGWW